jgi:hypothetical protein
MRAALAFSRKTDMVSHWYGRACSEGHEAQDSIPIYQQEA